MATERVYMSDSDAFSWYMEKDPLLRSTVVAVAWLDEEPSWDLLRGKLEVATRQAPSFRRRPLQPPLRLSPPRWGTDPHFDLDWHLRRVAAPPPHTEHVVLDMARVAAMAAFDHTRPLWEFTLVQGLVGGRAAMIMKLHHSLTDGIGGVQLAHLLVDDRPVTVPAVPSGAVPSGAEPSGDSRSGADVVVDALLHHGSRLAGTIRGGVLSWPQAAARVTRHPGQSVVEMVETALSVGRTVQPVLSTLSPVVTRRGPTRRLHMVNVGLEALKSAAEAGGGTVNDAFMSAIAGGLRRYHERHGIEVDELLVTLPISIRRADDPLGGNRITLQRFRVPVGIRDPVARIQAIDRCCRQARAERSLTLTNQIACALNLLPSAVVGSMLKHVDYVASDVPGFPRTVYLCGVPVSGYYAFGPTIGAAFNATLFSYRTECCIGVNVDVDAVPDDEVLIDCIGEGLVEVAGAVAPAAVTFGSHHERLAPC